MHSSLPTRPAILHPPNNLLDLPPPTDELQPQRSPHVVRSAQDPIEVILRQNERSAIGEREEGEKGYFGVSCRDTESSAAGDEAGEAG